MFADSLKAIDDHNSTDVVYLDFIKAFDSVLHDKLMSKLWIIGITGPLWYWFKKILSNQTTLYILWWVNIFSSSCKIRCSIVKYYMSLDYSSSIAMTCPVQSHTCYADDSSFITSV